VQTHLDTDGPGKRCVTQRFPGQPVLARFPLDLQSPVFIILSTFTGQAETLRITISLSPIPRHSHVFTGRMHFH